MMQLPEEFLSRMKASLGEEFPQYLAAMEQKPRRALRINTLKTGAEEMCTLFDGGLTPCPALTDCYYIPEDHSPGRDPLHAAGLYYMQEPSAQMPVSLLEVKPGEAVLDLCAAPGGKSGQIAQALKGEGLLISNEIDPKRAQVLYHTLERLGVTNAITTCMKPDSLMPLLSEGFDAVLVDAPCSGEGMFRRDETAIADWSPAHVDACAVRQSAILDSACMGVRPGGRMVYSTCTFSPQENEENVRAFLSRHPDFTLVTERHCYPHTGPGEGQYAALLRRDGEASPAISSYSAPKADRIKALDAFFKVDMSLNKGYIPRLLPDGRVFLLPARIPAHLDRIRTISSGIAAGEVHSDRFEPGHALFMACSREAFRHTVELDGSLLTQFLAGEAIPCDPSLKGYTAVLVHGHPVGFGKASGGTLKNHLPKGLRIR